MSAWSQVSEHHGRDPGWMHLLRNLKPGVGPPQELIRLSQLFL